MDKHEYTWRYPFLGAFLSVLPLIIAFQLVRIQLNPDKAKEFLIQGDSISVEYRPVSPPRGEILDRWGNVLAGNKQVYEVAVEVASVINPQTIALTLSTMLGVDYDMVLDRIENPPPHYYNVTIAKNISQEKVQQLEILKNQISQAYATNNDENAPSMEGIVFIPHLIRSYPEKSLAANILGYVNDNSAGVFGVEGKYNDLLSGKSVVLAMPLDPNRVEELPVIPGGASLVLTIERDIQRSMEDIIDAAVDETGSASGALVVMDPRTGEIMAMATMPRMDLNEFWRLGDVYTKDTFFNSGIMQPYEPGSVFKVLTMAAALDKGVVTPDTTFTDTGSIEIAGTIIYNWNMGAWGPQDMEGCLAHSLNVCLAWVATQLGTEDFYSYIQNFGIGRLSGVDMAGEVNGRLKAPGDKDW
jgi:cell division protein FtsI/penicillin-binding protein 2